MAGIGIRIEDTINIPIADVTSIPKNKEPTARSLGMGTLGNPGGIAAANSGIVEIKCVINGKCPFVKDNYMHDSIVFNAQSMRDFPQDVLSQLSCVEGEEGTFLRPQYVYRHTFIGGPAKEDKEELTSRINPPSTTTKPVLPSSDPFRTKLDPLTAPTGAFGAGAPDYERYQRFIICPSIFDTEYLTPSEYNGARQDPTSCDELAVWQYELLQTPAAFSRDTNSTSILMPKQVAGSNCGGFGVHWRVMKQTALFRGEDFFIEFHKRSRSLDVPQSIRDNAATYASKKFASTYYKPLDVTYNENEREIDQCGKNVILKRNRGVVAYSDDGSKVVEDKKYDLRDQAYYVIEIGSPGNEHHYFIIITQRGDPICVRIRNDVSYLVSQYNNGQNIEQNAATNVSRISGEQIVNADWCRITVRNHLGNLHIEFEGPNYKATPWIISRVDSNIIEDDEGEVARVEEKKVHMVVPKDRISIWGGNISAAFVFGMLEYAQGSDSQTTVGFTVPPQSPDQKAQKVCNSEEANPSGLSEADKLNGIAMPFGLNTELALTATDQDIDGITPFYTQDAQLFFSATRPASSTAAIPAKFARSANITKTNGTFYKQILLPVDTDESGNASTYKEVQTERESAIAVGFGPTIIDAARRMGLFKVEIKLRAGGHRFEDNDGGFSDSNEGKVWTVDNCKTPVMTAIRLVARPPKESTRWEARPQDVSEHVLEYNECWSAQDFNKIEHTGCIKFLLNHGAQYDNNQTEYLSSLMNKAFYIEVWVRYAPFTDVANRPLLSTTRSGCNYSKVEGYYKLFTGICYGGTITTSMGERIMECQIWDYSRILQDMRFFNSPFYDGVRDINAVREILQFGGFKDELNDDPVVLVRRFSEAASDQIMQFGIGPDGRLVPVQAYALPNSYSKLSQPFFKFPDGSPFYDGIMEIAKRGGKCFFFDAYGVAHYESYFDFAVVGVISGISNEVLGGEAPECEDGQVSTAGTSVVNAQSLALWWYTTNPSSYQGQMIEGKVKIQRAVGDVYNHVKILGNTPNFELIWADDVDWGSFDDPTQEGFLGYLRTVFQKDGIFGSEESIRNIIEFYKALRRPPLVFNFESFGLPVRALDTITVDGQLGRIMKSDCVILPRENKWWNSIECEWLYGNRSRFEAAGCSPASDTPSQE